MKKLRLASVTLSALTILPFLGSCSSDPNPFDKELDTIEQNTALIKLDLSVAGTRAGEATPENDPLATDAENQITKVNIYIFNEKHELEKTISNVAVGSVGEPSVTLEVSPGLRTIYVITAQSGVNPAKGVSFADFERQTFVSTLDKLNTSDGFVMFGKSNEQQVMISATKDEMPSSNVFPITLTRLVAKAQVKASSLDGSSFGFTLGAISFKSSQTSDRMMLVHNGSDLVSNYEDSNNNGTYDNYSIGDSHPYLNSVATDFSADGCVYMPENIVSAPKSGNTTFLSIKIATTPQKYHTFAATDQTPQVSTETPEAGTTYYVVGIVDREHGVSDYTVDTNGHVIAFKNQTDAQNYTSKLNTGEVSSITVSQTESEMKAPYTRAGETSTAQFEVFEYKEGYAYYRVNIAHEEKSGDSTVLKNKVVRNKFYKVNINSVKNLGFSLEAQLRPTKADAVLDAAGSSWIYATFIVAPWEEIEQKVDL